MPVHIRIPQPVSRYKMVRKGKGLYVEEAVAEAAATHIFISGLPA